MKVAICPRQLSLEKIWGSRNVSQGLVLHSLPWAWEFFLCYTFSIVIGSQYFMLLRMDRGKQEANLLIWEQTLVFSKRVKLWASHLIPQFIISAISTCYLHLIIITSCPHPHKTQVQKATRVWSPLWFYGL